MESGGWRGVSSAAVSLPSERAAPRRRGRADHRPQRDPACAGCPQLGLLRGLRRAGVTAEGRLSCEPPAGSTGPAALPGPPPVLAEAARGDARLLVLAGPDAPDLAALPGWPIAGARVVRVAPDDLPRVEAAVQRAWSHPGTTVLVAVATCQLEVPRAAPFAIAPSRCNRCGGCLSLGCPAIEDVGGEAMVIEPAVCVGCARCAPMCRGGAISSRG